MKKIERWEYLENRTLTTYFIQVEACIAENVNGQTVIGFGVIIL